MIPIFVITRDRLEVLKKAIESYKKLPDVEIVIHDNNSTYPQTIEYLKQLENEGIKVFWHKEVSGTFYDISESVDNTIQKWYETNDSNYYVVTDCDIEIMNIDSLKIYKDFLDNMYDIDVAGPMLLIDDLPEHYELRDVVIKSHSKQFWTKPLYSYKSYSYIKAPIDTTFGMYRKQYVFRRLAYGVRVIDAPAKHLDWYIDTNNLTDDQKWYKEHASKTIGGWSSNLLK